MSCASPRWSRTSNWFLPQINEAFRRGDLSYSKVRALTLVATESHETELLAFALDVSAARCEDHCRRLRNGDAQAAALERVGARLPEDPSRSLFARGADALVEMARESLAGGNEASSSAESHQVVVHVEACALSDQGGEADLPSPTVKRLCCDGAVVPVVERDGEPLNVGSKDNRET